MNEKRVSLDDRKHMTFRQAEGTETAPAALKWGELDEDLRLEIWNAIHTFLELNRLEGSSYFSETSPAISLRR